MAYCEECGNRIQDGQTRCIVCGAGGSKGAGVSATSGRKNMEGRAENEKYVRRYRCSNQGHLSVTNKRIIFEGHGSSSRVIQEIALDSVSGLSAFYGNDIRVWRILFGGVLILLGILNLYGGVSGYRVSMQMIVIGLALALLGIWCIVRAFKKSFRLSIYSSKANGTPISIGNGVRSLAGNGALYSLVSGPGPDTERMINELGAMVLDLQTLGDKAVEKWKY